MGDGHRRSNTYPVVGLTGGICSGKSVATRVFEEHGFERIDADALAHRYLCSPEVVAEIREAFGRSILDNEGKIDKQRLAAAAFRTEANITKLNSILHPRVLAEIKKNTFQTNAPIVIDAALLIETKLDEALCTHLVFIDRPLERRIKSATESRNWDCEELTKRENMQISPEFKREKADVVIQNKGSLSELKEKVSSIAKMLLVDFKRRKC